MAFHTSIEGAQHGGKNLAEFCRFAAQAGARGVQPSNFMLETQGTRFLPAAAIRGCLQIKGHADPVRLDGISAHCPFWVHGTAWIGSKTIRPFIPTTLHSEPPKRVEAWALDYIYALFDLCAELGIKIIPMFWGVTQGWEVGSGYPWGLWSGGDYDLVQEGIERFVTMTAPIRQRANEMGIYLAHEIHPGTAAMCADDFLTLLKACDFDRCLTVNADPSHCWEGEPWERRFEMVGDRIVACHIKNHTVRPGQPLRSMQPNWQFRGMQFTDLPSGDINLVRFVELLYRVGYARRYCEIMGTDTAPLITEAESAFRDLDATAIHAIAYTNTNLVFPFATGSFEDGMGAEKKGGNEE